MITRLGFASAAVMNAPEQHSNTADTRANATVSIFILDLLAEHCLQSGEHMPMVSFGNDGSTAAGGENRNFDTPVAGFGKFVIGR